MLLHFHGVFFPLWSLIRCCSFLCEKKEINKKPLWLSWNIYAHFTVVVILNIALDVFGVCNILCAFVNSFFSIFHSHNFFLLYMHPSARKRHRSYRANSNRMHTYCCVLKGIENIGIVTRQANRTETEANRHNRI